MKAIKVLYGQSVEDIAIQEYGALEGLRYLLPDNNLSLTELLYAGQELRIRTENDPVAPGAIQVVNFLKEQAVSPNNMLPGERDVNYVEPNYWEDGYTL